MSSLGLSALESLGLQAIAIFGNTPRSIGGITMDITLEETGVDEMAVTEHPVEQSAAISDHAYKKPARLTIRAACSNSSLAALLSPTYVIDTYNKLLALQAGAKLFTVVTGKRTYKNMLMTSLSITTDKRYETTLMVTAVFQELIIVQTSVTAVSAPASSQADPASNSSVTNNGTQTLQPAPAYNDNAPVAA